VASLCSHRGYGTHTHAPACAPVKIDAQIGDRVIAEKTERLREKEKENMSGVEGSNVHFSMKEDFDF